VRSAAMAMAAGGWAVAAHDVSDGGLAVALAEMLLAAPEGRTLGADVDLEPFEVDGAVALFCERPAILYEVPFEWLPRVSQAARDRGFVGWPVGTGRPHAALRVRIAGGDRIEWPVGDLRHARELPLRRIWNEEGV